MLKKKCNFAPKIITSVMKKLFLALMAIAAIALTGCNNPKNEPEETQVTDGVPPTPTPPTLTPLPSYDITCTCDTVYHLEQKIIYEWQSTYAEVYNVYEAYEQTGFWRLSLDGNEYSHVSWKMGYRNGGYVFWRCSCGNYLRFWSEPTFWEVIPDGTQPEEWNQFSYLWE